MSESDHSQGGPWVRGPLSPRIVAAVLPVIVLGALLGALLSLDGLGDFPKALVWALVAAAFGVASAWLLGVLLVPTEEEAARQDERQGERSRHGRRRRR